MPAILLSMLGVFGIAIAVTEWRARSARKAKAQRLEDASPAELAEEARRALAYGFVQKDLGSHVAAPDDWTDQKLLAALRAMYADIAQGDAARGASGRDGDVFSFYDSGLAAITEIVERRAQRKADATG